MVVAISLNASNATNTTTQLSTAVIYLGAAFVAQLAIALKTAERRTNAQPTTISPATSKAMYPRLGNVPLGKDKSRRLSKLMPIGPPSSRLGPQVQGQQIQLPLLQPTILSKELILL